MSDPQCFDPSLLTARQSDEEAQLDKFRLGEVSVELRPQIVIGDAGVPEDGARVAKGRLLAVIESIRILKPKQFVIIGFGKSLPSTLDGPLDPSVVTVNRLRYIHPAQFLDGMVEHSLNKCFPPGIRECVEHRGNVRPDRLAFRTRCPVPASVLK